LWYVALDHTSVSAATCVFDTSCVFTYSFSVLLLNEKIDRWKLIGMFLAVGGAIVTALYPGDNNQSSSDSGSQFSWLILVLAAAAGYGMYEVLFAKTTQGVADPACINVVTGMLGLINFVGFWVVLIPLNYLSTCPDSDSHSLEWCAFGEPFALPPSSKSWALLNANAATAMLFNVFFSLAIATTSPLLVSVGTMLSIPATALADLVLYQDGKGYQFILGAVLVVCGFLLMVYGDYKQQDSPDAELEDVLEAPELVGCVTSEPADADLGSHLNDSNSAIDNNALLTGEVKQ